MATVRWGILGTANIASVSFLPALHRLGGVAAVVGTRDVERGRKWSARNGVDDVVEGYEAVLSRPDIDAVYIPLPNSEHAEWTLAAHAAGKTVLCEKPLSVSVPDTERVLAGVEPGALLWEAFVFPFSPQMTAIREVVDSGAIGDVREILSCFHVKLEDPGNFRNNPALGGGSTFDLGGYPIHFARLLLGTDPIECASMRFDGASGIDEEAAGIFVFPEGRRLSMSCGYAAQYNSLTRIVGTEGELRVDNPFHPAPDNGIELWRAPTDDWHSARFVWRRSTGTDRSSFEYHLEHIYAVLAGSEEPRHLAAQDSLGTAKAIAAVLTGPRVSL